MLTELGKKAKEASRVLMNTDSARKNAALEAIAKAFEQNASLLLQENEKDLAAAKENGMPKAMLDRLALNPDRIAALSKAARELITLEDPVGKVISGTTRPNGI